MERVTSRGIPHYFPEGSLEALAHGGDFLVAPGLEIELTPEVTAMVSALYDDIETVVAPTVAPEPEPATTEPTEERE